MAGSHEGTAIVGVVSSPGGTVVAYEADDINTVERTGWSVVTGLARIIDDPDEAGRCKSALQPWLSGDMGCVIQIEPEIVTGFELSPQGPSRIRPKSVRRRPERSAAEAGGSR